MTSEEIIHQSAALRGQGQFRESIDLVKGQLSQFDTDLIFNAYHEMFLAAKEARFREEALGYAKKLLEIEPDLPSAQTYIAEY